MGIWDNLKSRFGRGNQDDYDDFDDDEYYDSYHDSYNGYADDDEYYDDDHVGASTSNAPLVSMTDIRSQPVALSRGAGSREDRIPMPVVRERRSLSASGVAEEDSEAFRDSLARSSQNSLIQLHSDRIALEANAVPDFAAASTSPTASAMRQTARSNSGRFDQVGTIRSNAGAVTPRAARQVEQLTPQSYADAENISLALRQGSVVVLNLTSVRPELAKRILDFSFGVTSAFDGQVDRFADRIYILTRNGALTEAERSAIRI